MEKLSGIKAHTIRIWEQRYRLLQPQRTDTNIRYYLDKDLRLLLNVALLKKNGLRISTIASMEETDISERVKELSKVNLSKETQLDSMTIAMIEMDEDKFNHILNSNIQSIGFEETMLDLIHPFMNKISALWLTGSINPIQESFTSYLIRQKMVVAIDQLPTASSLSPKFMIYIPEGETQELSILFMHFLLKSRGFRVVYLGQNVSLNDLQVAISIHPPDYIISMISRPFKKQSVQDYINHLSKTHPNVHWLFTGFQVASQTIEPSESYSVLNGLNDTLDFLLKLK